MENAYNTEVVHFSVGLTGVNAKQSRTIREQQQQQNNTWLYPVFLPLAIKSYIVQKRP